MLPPITILTRPASASPCGDAGGQLERWFAAQGPPPRYDLARSGAAGMTVAALLAATGTGEAALLDTSLDYGPGAGTERLASAISRHQGSPEDARVVVTNGAVEALLLLCVGGRGEVLVGGPAYSGLVSAPAVAGRRVATVPVWDPVHGLHLDEIAARVSDATGLVVINNPHNPSGARASLAAIDELATACAHHGAVLVVDEVARGTLSAAAPSAVLSRGFASGTTTVIGDVSKAMGLGGLRIGWLTTTNDSVAGAAAAAKDGTTVSSGSLAEQLAAIALEHAERLLAPVRAAAAANLARLQELVGERGLSSGWEPPADGLVAFPALCPDGDGEALARAARLRDVSIVPGSLFGEPERVRIGLGCPSPLFDEGLQRVGEALALL